MRGPVWRHVDRHLVGRSTGNDATQKAPVDMTGAFCVARYLR